MTKNKIKKIDYSLWLFGLISIFYFFSRILFIFSTPLENGDAASRALIGAYEFKFNKEIFIFKDWLPLPFFIFNVAVKFFNNPILVPRLISMFFGYLSLVAIFFMGHKFFNKIITLIVSFLAVVSTLSLYLETQPLAESIFACFILWGVFFFINYLQSKKSLLLFYSSLMFMFSSLVRYEALILIPAFISLLFIELFLWGKINKNAIFHFLFFAIISSFFFFNSAIINYLNLKQPFPFFEFKATLARRSISEIPYHNLMAALKGVFSKIISLLGITLPFFIIGLITSLKKKNLLLIIPIFLIISALIFQVYTARTEIVMERYLHIPYLFSLIFTAVGINFIFQKIANKKAFLSYLFLTIIFGLIFFNFSRFYLLAQKNKIPPETQQVISWLKENKNNYKFFIIDQSKYFEGARIVLYSEIKEYQSITDELETENFLSKLRQNQKICFPNNSLLIFEKDSPLVDYFKNQFFRKNLGQKIIFKNNKFLILVLNECYNL